MSSQQQIGWGVIGAGGIARRRTIPEGIVPARNGRLVAVMDVDSKAAREVGDQFGVPALTDVDALLRTPGIDAVYIATPNHLHKMQVLAAAESGKHVLCEKPLGINVTDIQQMIATCHSNKVLLGVGFMMRFNVYHRKLKELLDAGAFGKAVLARGQMSCWYPPMEGVFRQDPAKGGGGAFVDMGTHVVDVLEMLFGKTVSVMARTFNQVHDYAAEDTAAMILEFESGAAAMVDVSFAVPDETSEFVLEVYGSKGAVKAAYSLAQGPGGNFRLCLLETGKGYDAQQAVAEKGGFQPWELPTENTYQSEVEAFAQAVIDGTDAPVPGEAGLWSHAVTEAVYESARTGRMVGPKLP